MDLNYTDANRVDQGVLEAYTLDMAYGADENSFECAVDSGDHCCTARSLIYAEGEEYGGIVDSVAVDTESETITYKGRTWHGILEGKAICPEQGQDHLVLNGDANAVLGRLIGMIGLSDLFEASAQQSGITIRDYQVPRYVYAYSGIRSMLREFGGKLHIKWTGSKVQLSALPEMDYSQDEEFDASQTNFVLEQKYRPLNHVICLGQGNLSDRAVIHIFCDANGGIRPYATTDRPIQDSDYILGTSEQVLTGADEVVEVLDYPSAEIVTNYDLLKTKPSNWATKCTDYYCRDTSDSADGVSYKSVEWEVVEYELQKKVPYDWDVNFTKYYVRSGSSYNAVSGTVAYEALTVKPSDWAAKYENYYTKSGSTYKAVAPAVTEKYTRQTKAPKDWRKKYGEYYYFYSDGVTTEYKQVDGVSYTVYKLQTMRPTDWDEQYTNYYRRSTAAELKKETRKYRQVEAVVKKTTSAKGETVTQRVAPKWKAKTYYTALQREHAPDWGDVTRYTYTKTEHAPAWESGTYYEKSESAPPTWQAKKYYTKVDEKVAPKWTAKKYYKAVTDRYATLVENALQRLEEAHESSPMEISMEESDMVYDVGDIVGVTEPTTGISATQEIVKKIIKITNDDVKITYEVQ